jgi:hypothetical protein
MNENVKKVVARILKDIQVEMSDEFDKNFERQAFFSEKWQRRKSPIRIPRRRFLGTSPEVEKAVREIVEENLTEYFTIEYNIIRK